MVAERIAKAVYGTPAGASRPGVQAAPTT